MIRLITYLIIVSVFSTSLIAQSTEGQKLFRPEILPQEPVIPKLQPDAVDSGLKGKVKKIVQEREDLSGKDRQGRRISYVEEYNEKGNFLRREYYDSDAKLSSIVSYGYIDGKRVSKSQDISQPNSPPLAIAIPGSAGSPARDARYDYSLEYKYADRKLSEMQMVVSSGRKGVRYVYNHTDGQTERLVYTDEGKLNQRSVMTLDKDGNVIEETVFGLENFKLFGDKKYRYTYEFDNQGNWTKKTASLEKKIDGVTSFQPAYTQYRTITYHK